MHIAHVIRDLDVDSGGPSRSLPSLADTLANAGNGDKISVLFQDRGNRISVNARASDIYRRGASGNGLQRIRSISRLLHDTQNEAPIDIAHLHGLWSPTLNLAARYFRRRSIPYIVSPRGMLSNYCRTRHSGRKHVAWLMYQLRDLRKASCIHCTSTQEAADVRSLNIGRPIATIPHGCDPPAFEDADDDNHVIPAKRTAVTISRLHPVKQLPLLIDAWSEANPKNWRLLIAGPDTEGHGAELKQQINERGLVDEIDLIGPVDGKDKWALFASAELFISPSASENFGMSIAESLATGTPAIVTRGAPWEDIQRYRCGWWIPATSDSLKNAITDATSMQSMELSQMGSRGARLMESEYSWKSVGRRLREVYEWSIDDAVSRPSDIH